MEGIGKKTYKKEYVEPVLMVEKVEMEQGIGTGSAVIVEVGESFPEVENDTYGEVIGGITTDW